MPRGVHTRPAEMRLAERAASFLERGPSDAVSLIEYVCQMPGAPRVVAEQMAFALFAERTEFTRDAAGQWHLVDVLADVQRDAVGAPAASSETDVELLSNLSYVVVDVETTGSRAWGRDRVTEVAAVVVRDGQVVDRYETLINPERSIPPRITALTHITREMVRHAPRFADVCDRVLQVLDGKVFVAHNAEFDWRFLEAEVARATGRRLTGRRLCTVRMARRLLPQLRNRCLDSVADYYGVEIEARHRAGGDAAATARVFIRMLADATTHECHAWHELQSLLSRRSPRRKRRRPARPHPVERDTTA